MLWIGKTSRLHDWYARGLVFAWTVLVLGGMVALARYASRPGMTAAAATLTSPANWPGNSALNRPLHWKLVVALHPGCPCSRATVTELSKILAATRGTIDVDVLVWRPEAGASPDDRWIRGELAGVPGVTLVDDLDGAEAKRFGAEVSGHVTLFDPAGQRRFVGGITSTRGHEGDNDGEETIIELVRGEVSPDARAATPVFGCALGVRGGDAGARALTDGGQP